MLFDIDRINRFLALLMWSKTSVIPKGSSFPNTKQVGDGVLMYGSTYAEIKVYTCDDVLFRDKTSVIGFQGDFLTLVFDQAYFDKLIKSKFKSAFFGACAIQVARYVLQEVKKVPEMVNTQSNDPPCIPSHKPEIAQFFFHRSRKENHPRFKRQSNSYLNFIGQALLRGGFDIREFTVDKEAVRFVPIDDVLAAHAVDVETGNNVFLSAERVNRIRALNHYYETDLTDSDGCELHIDLS